MIQLAISHHAFERARERLGWSRPTLARMLDRVFHDGVTAAAPQRKIREYLHRHQTERPGLLARAYGEHLFLFSREPAANEAVLVTTYPLPHGLRRPARDARRLAHAA